MIESIQISKLFNQFDYDIKLKEEGITILTGPNGYGKTTILKILNSIATNNYPFLHFLPFKSIIIKFSDIPELNINKVKEDLILNQSDNSNTLSYKKFKNILKNIPVQQIGENRWQDMRTEEIFEIKDIINSNYFNENKMKFEFNNVIFPSIHLIIEQRLLKKIKSRRRHYPEEINTYTETIKEYSEEFKEKISTVINEHSQLSQELDSTFPKRLFEETNKISESEFNERFNKIQEIQNTLYKFGLLASKEDTETHWTENDAKALLVYINDTEKKLLVFDELIHKLTIFSDILNNKRLVFKEVQINKNEGIIIKANDGNTLSLSELSSGEQQEIVLLFELLFKVETGSIVLIDEPEISLHVAWQIEFLDDLKKIVDLRKINVILATHSPQIIHNHWDWVVDLKENSSGNTEE